MVQISITLPDKTVRNYSAGITPLEIAKNISEGLAKNVLAAEFNGSIVDATLPITQDGTLRLLTWDDPGGRSTCWHSSAHIMAEALERLYPGIKLGIGPAIEQGFYYDIDFGGHSFTQEDFPKVEKLFLEIAASGETFNRKNITKQQATAYFTQKNDPYKLELIEGLEDGQITFYESGNFTDLCKGPHIPNSQVIKAVKLLNVAGAYWRGNENNPMMTRVYAISFLQKKDLAEFLLRLEEAKKRDHRKLGKDLGLFYFSENVGLGLPLWLPKGALLRERLEQFMRQAQQRAGYLPVVTPHIGNKKLYTISGHYEKYGKDSFQPIRTPQEGEEFFLKPMNCPHHCEIYKSQPRSYKDLPLRFAEFGTVYRYEQSGELHGLTRVRGFTQDDAHLFCQPEQVKEEFGKVIDLVLYVFKSLNFQEYTAQISLRDPNNPEKYIGSDENWQLAEQAIIESVQEKNLPTVIEVGEAAFYGPKLDFMVRDAIGRKWQLGTIQVDYNLPERFELEYTGADNQKHRPVMIHRAPFGSIERFIAVLIEHCAGDFPLWLAPEQVIILSISDKFNDYAVEIQKQLSLHEIRVVTDLRSEKVGRKIRDAELSKYPIMIILGEKELENESVSVRRRGFGDLGVLTISNFIKQFNCWVHESLNQ